MVRKIGVIGAGSIGGILARKLGKLGYSVKIANSRGPETLAGFDADGVTPAWALDAVDGADLVIISLPQRAVAALDDDLVKALRSVPIVIDTGNYYPARDGQIAGLEHDDVTDSEWVAQKLGRPVFKAFNNIGALSLLEKGALVGAAERVALSVAGAPGAQKRQVMDLIDQLGFDPVDGGELQESWRQQPGTPAYCADLSADELRARIQQVDRASIPDFRANRDAQDPIGGTARQHTLIEYGQRRATVG